MNELYSKEQAILKKARETYGNKNQILVCMEELNELACALAKYPRYEDETKATYELHNKVLDEVADVVIILDHIQSIFNIEDLELAHRIEMKVERLDRWLTHSTSMQETIDDRKVVETVCKGCIHEAQVSSEEYTNYCLPCSKAMATDGSRPFYEEK